MRYPFIEDISTLVLYKQAAMVTIIFSFVLLITFFVIESRWFSPKSKKLG